MRYERSPLKARDLLLARGRRARKRHLLTIQFHHFDKGEAGGVG